VCCPQQAAHRSGESVALRAQESFKGKPEVWKQIEKDGKAISPAKFNEGRGKKSKALSDCHDAVRTKSNRGRKPKAL